MTELTTQAKIQSSRLRPELVGTRVPGEGQTALPAPPARLDGMIPKQERLDHTLGTEEAK